MTYVFRGAKKEFVNPFVSPDTSFPASELDPQDEDYEPHPAPKPRLLWPTAPGTTTDTPDLTPASSRIDAASTPSTRLVTPARRKLFTQSDYMEVDEMPVPSRVFLDIDLEEEQQEPEPEARRGTSVRS